MFGKIIAASAAFVMLVAALPPGTPETLHPYFEDNKFSSGNFEWLRGAFPEATEAEKFAYQGVTAWLKECSAIARSKTIVQLREMGVENSQLDNAPLSLPVCDQVASTMPQVDAYDSFADFQRHLATTQPIFDAMVATTVLAERIAGPPTDALTDELLHRPMAEQIYRNALSWAWRPNPVEGIPSLTDKQKPIFLALLSSEIANRDRTNTLWLKEVVSENGWPTFSLVGEDASQKAWLLVQHADHDPVFQLEVLRLMEPLVRQEEVSPRNYAYLYDRVMLKLTGTQRYATQVMCQDGERVPLPLENENTMPEFRRSVGMDTFAEYVSNFSSPCPKK